MVTEPLNGNWRRSDFPDWLADRLRHPLPGRAGQSRFSPELGYGRHFGPPPHDSRQGAVLVLLYPDGHTWRCPMIVRPNDMLSHAGQVCFPGGELDPGETFPTAAIREFGEELGVQPADLRVLGELTPLTVFASNFWVVPILATTATRPEFHPNEREVAELLEPTMDELAGVGHHHRRPIARRGVVLEAPGILIAHRHFLWGATAMMVGELLAIIEERLRRKDSINGIV